MEQCPKCGELLTLTHACRQPLEQAASDPDYRDPENLLGYLNRGWAIAMLRDRAIRATARDPRALRYGLGFLVAAVLLVRVGAELIALVNPLVRSQADVPLWAHIIVPLLVAACFTGTYLVFAAAFHLAARRLLHGRGTYRAFVSPWLLASPVMLTVLIPGVGLLISGLWRVLILVCVAEEVEGIRRPQAFALSVAVSVVLVFAGALLIGLVR